MFVVRAAKKLRDRLGPALQPGEMATTRLGDWYATAWFWKPQIDLFVSEATLFPVVMPAPGELGGATYRVDRFARTLGRPRG